MALRRAKMGSITLITQNNAVFNIKTPVSTGFIQVFEFFRIKCKNRQIITRVKLLATLGLIIVHSIYIQ